MIHRASFDQDVARDGVFLQVVLLREALHLLFPLLLLRKSVFGLDVELGRLGLGTTGNERKRRENQEWVGVLAMSHS